MNLFKPKSKKPRVEILSYGRMTEDVKLIGYCYKCQCKFIAKRSDCTVAPNYVFVMECPMEFCKTTVQMQSIRPDGNLAPIP